MNTDLETISPEWVGDQLVDLGVVRSLRGVHLQPLSRNPERVDYATRQAFRLWSGRKTVCFLLIGPGLENIWRRARAFSRACPDIAAKPIFLQRTIRTDFLGLEFVEGGTLEDAVRQGQLSLPESGKAALAVFSALERTFRASTAAAAHTELEQFFASVLSCPIFGTIDGGFLRDVVFPWVRAGAISQPARTRWTNGDLVAHNIIFDGQGCPRLVDYEFAHRTHFFAEDVLRWHRFSEVHKEIFDKRLPATTPWMEAFFLLRQTVLESQIANPQLSLDGANERVRRLRELASEAHSQFRASLFLRPLAPGNLARNEAELKQLTATLVEQQARVVELDAEVVKRGEWGLTLEASLKEANQRAAELQASVEERSKWAQNLDLEIAQLRESVGSARAERDQFSRKVADADAALAAQQARVHELDAEVVKRSEWGLSLEASLKEANQRAAELQASVEERTQRAQTLDREVSQLRNTSESLRRELSEVERQRLMAEQQSAELASKLERSSGCIRTLEARVSTSESALEEKTQESARLLADLDMARRTEQGIRQQLVRADEDLHQKEAILVETQTETVRLMQEIEDRIKSADAAFAAQQARIHELDTEVVKRGEWGLGLDANLKAANQRTAELQALVEERTKWAQTLDREVAQLRNTSESLRRKLSEVERQRLMGEQQSAELATKLERSSSFVQALEERLSTTESALGGKTQEASRLSADLDVARHIEQGIRQQLVRADEDLHQKEAILVEAQTETVRLLQEIEETALRRAWLEDKVRRMQNSFSWKSTAALRAFRRLFLVK